MTNPHPTEDHPSADPGADRGDSLMRTLRRRAALTLFVVALLGASLLIARVTGVATLVLP